jgi:N-acyl-D-amino-acid deacylase
MKMQQDLLVRDARIIDGSGAPWFRGDVRIVAGRIAEVGPRLAADGAEQLAADGRYLAPGFIDAHCHDDLAALREPERLDKASQGVTTVVVGNCSFSLYPATSASREELRRHFSGLLGETSGEEIFDDFAAYRTALEQRGTALNVVSLVGHAALRLAVLGTDDRPADAEERGRMQALLARQLRAGAAGLSLGLVYPPSAFADTAELVALAETVAQEGGLVAAHARNYEAGLLEAVEEFVAVLRAARVPGLLSHLQAAGGTNWGLVQPALARLEAARAAGIDVSVDMYPYTAGSSYALQLLPPEALAGGLPALLARLHDPVQRAALRRRVEEPGDDPRQRCKVAQIGWENVQISGTSNPALKALEGRRMPEAAASLGLAPFDLLARLIEADAGQTGVVMFQLDPEDVRCVCGHRLHMFGSDSLPRPGTKPHPRAFGCFPRAIGRLQREAGWFPLEDAVRRMTSMPAQRFALLDRGLLRPGMAADLVLFEAAVEDHASFDEPTRLSTGIAEVWVAGERIVADGHSTGRRPGRVLA